MSSTMVMMVGMLGSMAMVCLCIVCLSMLLFGSQMMSPGTAPTDQVVDDAYVNSDVPRAPEGCAYLFEDKDGQGTPLMACLDGRREWSIKDFGTVNDNYHDKASILDVGKGVTVKLYEHANFNLNKRGKVIVKSRPEWVDLTDLGFGKKASSLRLTKN